MFIKERTGKHKPDEVVVEDKHKKTKVVYGCTCLVGATLSLLSYLFCSTGWVIYYKCGTNQRLRDSMVMIWYLYHVSYLTI